MVTMLLTGIWHGAGLQFIVFGLIHGVYLTANQAWRHFRQRVHNAPAPPKPAGLLRLAMMIGVYLQVTFALIFFRSDSMHSAFALLARHVRPQRRRPASTNCSPEPSPSPSSRSSGSSPTPSRSSARRPAPAASPPHPARPTSTQPPRPPSSPASAGPPTSAGCASWPSSPSPSSPTSTAPPASSTSSSDSVPTPRPQCEGRGAIRLSHPVQLSYAPKRTL